MTTTQALKRLYRKFVGKESKKNSVTKILNEFADNWKLPPPPSNYGDYTLRVADLEGQKIYLWVAANIDPDDK